MSERRGKRTPTQPPQNAIERPLGEGQAAHPNPAGRHLGEGQIGLEEEIALVRLTIRQLYSLAQEQDAEQAVRTLNALSACASRLARLVQTQASLRGGEDEISAALSAALNQVMEEFGICP